MSFAEYLRTLRRGWWLVAVCVLLGALLALAASALQKPTYQTAATVFITVPGDGTPNDRAGGNNFAVSRAITYAQVAQSSQVLETAASRLQGVTVDDLRQSIAAVSTADTAIVTITATGPGARLVADEANAVAASLSSTVDDLEQASTPGQRVHVDVVTAAEVPEVALSPQPRSNLIIGVVVGLAIGIAMTVVLQTLSSSIRGPGDMGLTSSIVPISIPRSAAARRRGATPEGRREAYRTLRAHIRYASGSRATIAVAGTAPGSESRSIAIGLLGALSEVGSTVLLIDADFRPDRLRAPFLRARDRESTPDRPGLAEVLKGSAGLTDSAAEGPNPNSWYLRPGSPAPSTSQDVSSDRMRSMLVDAAATFDYVLVVCPPVLERSETLVLAAEADTTVLVVAARSTTRNDLTFALERFAGVGVTTPTIVIDDVAPIDMQARPHLFLGSGDHIDRAPRGAIR